MVENVADRWFARWGEATIFFSRLLPVVRTFISFPAGVARMHFGRFVLYTFLGSYPWCLGLGYIGKVLGAQWRSIREYFHKFDALIGIVIVALVVLYLYRHLKR